MAVRKISRVLCRGAMIVIEGGDNCGKTTHCTKLAEALRQDGKMAEIVKFPDRKTSIGRVISNYLMKNEDLNDHAVHLIFAANRWEAMPQMKQQLVDGVTLIVDRYSYSGVAYSMAKEIKGMDMKWCWQSEVGLLRPDAVILLTVSPDAAVRRQVNVPERFEAEDSFQERVLGNLRNMRTATWTEIDTSRDVVEVHVEIKAMVDRVMRNLPPTIEHLQ